MSKSTAWSAETRWSTGAMWRRIVKRCARLIVLASLASLSAGANAADFSYSYLEITGDLSKTRNTAEAPLEDDADGRLFGIAGSFEVFDGYYLKGAWSRETKEFGNEAAGTPVDLDSRQTVTTLGAGYRVEAGEGTSLYAEALMIVDFEVEHSVPLVISSSSGPPTVTTTQSFIEGNGLGGALGMRHWTLRERGTRGSAVAHPYFRRRAAHRRGDFGLGDDAQDCGACARGRRAVRWRISLLQQAHRRQLRRHQEARRLAALTISEFHSRAESAGDLGWRSFAVSMVTAWPRCSRGHRLNEHSRLRPGRRSKNSNRKSTAMNAAAGGGQCRSTWRSVPQQRPGNAVTA